MGIDEWVFSKIKNQKPTIAELQENLNLFNSLVDDIATENGNEYCLEKRVRVEETNGIRIDIKTNDHNPPHFHAEYGGHNASYRIIDCTNLAGELPPPIERKIRYWYSGVGKENCERIWNESRPTNRNNHDRI